jgi:hypothetical protein
MTPSRECDCGAGPKARRVWRTRDDGLQEAVEFVVGYKCTLKGPRSHGQHGMEIRWYLRGPKGVAQFVMYTDWPPSSQSPRLDGRRSFPMAADLGYHALSPQYDGHIGRDDCHLIDGECFYDGSGLQAKRLMERFFAEGEDAIWTMLQWTYEQIE